MEISTRVKNVEGVRLENITSPDSYTLKCSPHASLSHSTSFYSSFLSFGFCLISSLNLLKHILLPLIVFYYVLLMDVFFDLGGIDYQLFIYLQFTLTY